MPSFNVGRRRGRPREFPVIRGCRNRICRKSRTLSSRTGERRSGPITTGRRHMAIWLPQLAATTTYLGYGSPLSQGRHRIRSFAYLLMPPSGSLRDPGIKFPLGVALGNVRRRQHLLDLARLPCSIEFLQPLLAKLGHRFHGGLEIFARVEL